MNHDTGIWEWMAPNRPPAPTTERITSGTLCCSWVRNQYFVDWFTRLSMASVRKSPNMISITGRRPVTADPNPAPASANSEIGVSKTRSDPYFSWRPVVVAKTPPATATSSPKRITRSSSASASSSASRIAVRKVVVIGRRPRLVSVGSQGQGQRSLEQLAQAGEELRGVRAVDDAVVAGERDGDHVAEPDPVGALLERRAPGAADGEDRRLRRIDDRGERPNAEHPEVRHRERRVVELVRTERPPAGGVGETPRVGGDLGERLLIRVEHDGYQKRVLGGDGDADVDARV